MLLPRFDYHEPQNLKEACEIMSRFKGRALPLAAGTDVLVNMKKKVIKPENVVSLARIKELKEMRMDGDQLIIGSGITVADIAASKEIKRDFSALCLGAENLGSPLVRNLATIGGNIVSARPAADIPPSLIAYSAKLVLVNKAGNRKVPLEDFFKGPGKTIIASDELLTEIVLEKAPPYSGGGYIKLGVRKALEISMVNVAVFLSLESPKGVIRSAKIVLGAVGPIPLRAPAAEYILINKKPSEALFVKAGEAAAQDSKPIDDFRGSAQYRREMVKVLTKRALVMALEDAKARA